MRVDLLVSADELSVHVCYHTNLRYENDTSTVGRELQVFCQMHKYLNKHVHTYINMYNNIDNHAVQPYNIIKSNERMSTVA